MTRTFFRTLSGALLLALVACQPALYPTPTPSPPLVSTPEPVPPLPPENLSDNIQVVQLPETPQKILEVGSQVILQGDARLMVWDAQSDRLSHEFTLMASPLGIQNDPQQAALYLLFDRELQLRSPSSELKLLSTLKLPETPKKLVFSTREPKAWLRMEHQIWELELSRDRDKITVLERIPLSEPGRQLLIFDRWLVYDEGQVLRVREGTEKQIRTLPLTKDLSFMDVVYQDAKAPSLVVVNETALQLCDLAEASLPCQSATLPYPASSLLMVPALGMAYLPNVAEITVLDFVAGQPIDTLKQPAKQLYFPPPVVGLQVQHLGDIYGAGDYPVEIWAAHSGGIRVFNGHTLKVAKTIELPFEQAPQVAYAENTAYVINGQNPRLYAINRRKLGVQLD